jgi:predicted alpha/beta-hydrolase family hydrolase
MDELRFAVGDGEVSGLLDRPVGEVHGSYVLAHGAGAGMRHPFLADVAGRLSARGIAVLRYQFPYMETRQRRPDPPAVATATVRAAIQKAAELLPGVPLHAGGKSFGGRMTSQLAAAESLPIESLVFLGFPLHPPKQPGIARAAHLADIPQRMLFLQGTRDDLADLTLLEQVLHPLGDRATLHVVDGADHSFHVLKRSGRTNPDVMDELIETMTAWMRA